VIGVGHGHSPLSDRWCHPVGRKRSEPSGR
jgi:hypothetical protein